MKFLTKRTTTLWDHVGGIVTSAALALIFYVVIHS